MESTDEPPTGVPEAAPSDKPSPGLYNNPGNDGKRFSDRHPYFPKGYAACSSTGNKLFALLSDLAGRKNCA